MRSSLLSKGCVIILFFSCQNTQENPNSSIGSDDQQDSIERSTDRVEEVTGYNDTVTEAAITDIEGSSKTEDDIEDITENAKDSISGNNTKEPEIIKHGVDDQAKLDSIKAAKNKKKF